MISRPGLARERLLALFLFGVLFFTPPFLSIFNSPERVFGIPFLYLYLFTAWALLILLLALVIERSDAEGNPGLTELPSGSVGPADDKPGL
jgi:hypothetical protein